MKTARRVIEWNGTDDQELLREFHGLPPGRYAIVPANELDELRDEDERELTRDEIAGIDLGLEQIERGETVPAAEVYAAIDVRLRATAAARKP